MPSPSVTHPTTHPPASSLAPPMLPRQNTANHLVLADMVVTCLLTAIPLLERPPPHTHPTHTHPHPHTPPHPTPPPNPPPQPQPQPHPTHPPTHHPQTTTANHFVSALQVPALQALDSSILAQIVFRWAASRPQLHVVQLHVRATPPSLSLGVHLGWPRQKRNGRQAIPPPLPCVAPPCSCTAQQSGFVPALPLPTPPPTHPPCRRPGWPSRASRCPL